MENHSYPHHFMYHSPIPASPYYWPQLQPPPPPQQIGKRRYSHKSTSKIRGDYIRNRSAWIRQQNKLFECTKCKKSLPFDDYGKRTREKLVGGSGGEVCRKCRSTENKLQVGSKKWKKRLRHGTLDGGWKKKKKPKPFTLTLLLKQGDVEKLQMLKANELKTFTKKTKATFVIDPLNANAIERTGRLTGTVPNLTVAVKHLARLFAEVKRCSRHHIEFCVENENVGCLVGSGGTKVNAIREETGATVRIGQSCLPGSSCVRVRIYGQDDQFTAAIDRAIRQMSEGRKPTVIPYHPPSVTGATIPELPIELKQLLTI